MSRNEGLPIVVGDRYLAEHQLLFINILEQNNYVPLCSHCNRKCPANRKEVYFCCFGLHALSKNDNYQVTIRGGYKVLYHKTNEVFC